MGIKISELNPAPIGAETDLLPIVKDGQTMRITVGMVAEFAETAIVNGPLGGDADFAATTQAALDGKADASHTHDDRYYTETEADALLAGKADASHTHEADTLGSTGATSGQVLTADGAGGAAWADAAGGGLVNGGTFAATGTAIDFNSLPASIKKLHLVFSDLETNGSSSIICQLGTSAAFKTSNYKGGLVIAGSSSSSALITNGLGVDVSNSSTAISHGAIDIFRQDANKFTSRSVCSRSAPNAFGSFGGSSVDLIDELTRLRVTTVNGTDSFTAGNITILWEI